MWARDSAISSHKSAASVVKESLTTSHLWQLVSFNNAIIRYDVGFDAIISRIGLKFRNRRYLVSSPNELMFKLTEFNLN